MINASLINVISGFFLLRAAIRHCLFQTNKKVNQIKADYVGGHFMVVITIENNQKVNVAAVSNRGGRPDNRGTYREFTT